MDKMKEYQEVVVGNESVFAHNVVQLLKKTELSDKIRKKLVRLSEK